MSEFVLYSERVRRRARDEREAAGESLWTAAFASPVRRKIAFAAKDVFNSRHDSFRYSSSHRFGDLARDMILRSEGWMHLEAQSPRGKTYHDSVWDFALNCEDELYPTFLEAISIELDDLSATFASNANHIMRENRVSFELVDGRMIPFESQEMHVAIVVPTITLLSGRPAFSGVEGTYKKALEEIARGDAGDAITDAGTALQQTLEALGCTGSALGPLIKDAKRKGLLASHDPRLTEGIENTLHWVSADRSESGDAHKATEAYIEDAWLTVHVVGALILRLASGPLRGVPGA